MNIDIQLYQAKSMAAEIDVLVKFRLRYFREFPYLYVGTEEGERRVQVPVAVGDVWVEHGGTSGEGIE